MSHDENISVAETMSFCVIIWNIMTKIRIRNEYNEQFAKYFRLPSLSLLFPIIPNRSLDHYSDPSYG